MMQKLRVNSIAMRAPLCECRCARSIVTPAHSSDLSHPTHSIKIGRMPELPFSDPTDVETSTAPSDFASASSFRPQRQDNDPLRKAMFIGLAIVLLVFLGSMIAVLLMHAPRL